MTTKSLLRLLLIALLVLIAVALGANAYKVVIGLCAILGVLGLVMAANA